MNLEIRKGVDKMSEEEKEAIEYLKARLNGNEGCELIDVAQSDLRIIIKLVDRVLKADKNWQEIYDDQEENIREKNNKICEFEFIIENQQKELNTLKEIEQAHKTDNGLLRQELDMQIEHNKELDATLKQTQDSWFEDTQKIEQEKASNKFDKGLYGLLMKEKEKNKELEKDNKNLNILLDVKNKDVTHMLLNYISKDKIKAIVDEHIPKQPNIITGEVEYAPNTNANSFLVQDILKLLEEK